ncbi:undecaprenyl-diphosphatase [Paenibacillus zanthoxyli]|uniref:undecaprenyl-diphosphatase n=1 Tax=Paenibacillus zanthoxyli TaxID=369399 RepID=UPI0004727C3E|nr:undecaprenyl-diphosphatase [Paenibacillus zanthoxyli]
MNYQLFQIINGFAGQWDWIDDLMEFFAQDIVWLMIVMLGVLWFTHKEQHQRSVFYACLSAVIALLLAAILISPEVNEPRPFANHIVHQLIPHSADTSFPSDHSTLAFSLAFSLFFVNRKWGAISLAMACLTGFARVYVGVHYPGDIAGAAVLSALTSFLVYEMRSRLDPVPNLLIRIYDKIISVLPILSRK